MELLILRVCGPRTTILTTGIFILGFIVLGQNAQEDYLFCDTRIIFSDLRFHIGFHYIVPLFVTH